MMFTRTPDQVVKDYQLLDTARDYFRFVTNFFEVINVSATHIYHTALEFSPLSSVVRKLYYSQRSHPIPRVLMGVQDSWDDVTASVSTKCHFYISSTWSPCGQFVAAATDQTVEIRGALALNLIFTLRSVEATIKLGDRLAYSPDGHSLAYCFNTAIIIWDTQTGGVARKLYCEVAGDFCSQLVWSLDGDMIGIVFPQLLRTTTVRVYEVASGAMRSFSTANLTGNGYLWAHNRSFRLMTTTRDDEGSTIDIYEVGFALSKVERYHFRSHHYFEVFSPATYRISTSVSYIIQHELLIMNVRNSEVLLRESGSHNKVTFSPDGNFVAAHTGGHLLIWRYTSGHYIRWRKLQQDSDFLRFSPTSSSILSCVGALLHVSHLDHSPPATAIEDIAITRNVPLDAYPSHGAYIVTTHRGESVITITDLRSKNPSPSQFIDTGLEILAIVLTGDILLVKDSDTFVAWLLTEEGVVGGISGGRRADRSDSLWDTPFQPWGESDSNLQFSVEGEIVTIEWYWDPILYYHTKTGEILDLDGPHLGDRQHYSFDDRYDYNRDRYHYDSYRLHEPSECRWRVSLQEEWVRDSEGKHRLWLHPRWRSQFNRVDWFDKVTTMRLKSSSELVIIKF